MKLIGKTGKKNNLSEMDLSNSNDQSCQSLWQKICITWYYLSKIVQRSIQIIDKKCSLTLILLFIINHVVSFKLHDSNSYMKKAQDF